MFLLSKSDNVMLNKKWASRLAYRFCQRLGSDFNSFPIRLHYANLYIFTRGIAMKPFSPYRVALSLAILTSCALCQPALAATPAAQDKFRIHTHVPKRTLDSLFSVTAEWRIDEGELFRVTGLSFLNPNKIDAASANPDSFASKKLQIAIKDGLIQLDPNWRGIVLNQVQDQPEVTISNKAGYSLTNITFRDYSNQAVTYDLVDKSFTEAGVQIAFDLMYTADVEYLEGFTHKTAQTASQGEIIIQIDQQTPVHIKTDGKTTKALEEEIAKHISQSQTSITPLYPALTSSDTRNIKPFDGSEVQFLNLAAKSISIDITDPALGVLSKFKYPDDNSSVHVLEPRFMMAVLAVLSLASVLFFWWKNKKKSA